VERRGDGSGVEGGGSGSRGVESRIVVVSLPTISSTWIADSWRWWSMREQAAVSPELPVKIWSSYLIIILGSDLTYFKEFILSITQLNRYNWLISLKNLLDSDLPPLAYCEFREHRGNAVQVRFLRGGRSMQICRICAISLFILALYGQETIGRINGTVADSTGVVGRFRNAA
jgi:hypothetical protein